ncbi:MAG: exodeoxyribonuclease VII small subunit [Opitutales bacterium]
MSARKKSAEALPYEQAVERLETLIMQMESGEIALAEMVTKYEEGVKLWRNCESQLGKAQATLEQIRETRGDLALEGADEMDFGKEDA